MEAGRAEVRAVIARARERRLGGRETIFFLDEIHRFNKAQQDALLPAVEEGLVTLIGATTENPSFEVNRALLSRTRLYELSELTEEDVLSSCCVALGAGRVRRGRRSTTRRSRCSRQASGGDARTALSALELACETAVGAVTVAARRRRVATRIVHYDKKADSHYDTISAWIKATRGSDPDASLYYLAVMLEGGEDPRFIARRMVILASEDIGNADPQRPHRRDRAPRAPSSTRACPSASSRLAQAAIYLSLAPKSDAAKRAIGAARDFVREHGARLPCQLRSGGRGEGYDNPHLHPGHLAEQELAPRRRSASASTSPTRPRRSWPSVCGRFAAQGRGA